MALPEIVRGRFDGKTFAVNFTGLMLSSAAVKAGLATIRWVVPLGRLSRYKSFTRFLKVARGVPGWIYAGVETAVILYFGESISTAIGGWLEERKARSEVARAAEQVFVAARAPTGRDDPRLREALEEAALAYSAWRDRSLRPALAATSRLSQALEEAGREATIMGTGVSHFDRIAGRYPGLSGSVERIRAKSEAEVDRKIEEAVARFGERREEALRRAYHEGLRGTDYDPIDDARSVSENRPEAYEDEASLYEAAAEWAASLEAAYLLRDWAVTTREIRDRERSLLDPALSTGSAGVREALEEALR
jgi:hypothetical protein